MAEKVSSSTARKVLIAIGVMAILAVIGFGSVFYFGWNEQIQAANASQHERAKVRAMTNFLLPSCTSSEVVAEVEERGCALLLRFHDDRVAHITRVRLVEGGIEVYGLSSPFSQVERIELSELWPAAEYSRNAGLVARPIEGHFADMFAEWSRQKPVTEAPPEEPAP